MAVQPRRVAGVSGLRCCTTGVKTGLDTAGRGVDGMHVHLEIAQILTMQMLAVRKSGQRHRLKKGRDAHPGRRCCMRGIWVLQHGLQLETGTATQRLYTTVNTLQVRGGFVVGSTRWLGPSCLEFSSSLNGHLCPVNT